MFLKSLITISIVFFCSNAIATPIDYNGDSITDPSTYIEGTTIQWNSILKQRNTVLVRSFGKTEEFLVPGNYLGATTIPAVLSSDGTWQIRNQSNIKFGDNTSLFIAGADFDGDGKTDIAYSTNACSTKRSNFSALLNPLGVTSQANLISGKGNYFKVYFDSNNDLKDEICTVTPLSILGRLFNRFRLSCKDVITQQRTANFLLGKVNNQPLPIKVNGGTDFIALYETSSTSTNFRIMNSSGRQVAKFKLPKTGEILIGNFTNQDHQEIAIVQDGVGLIYDFILNKSSEIQFPEGSAYDQINLVNFVGSDNCYCTSKLISRTKKCDTTGGTIEPEVDQIFIPDNCSNPPNRITFNDGFKCMASNTRGGSIVCLLPYQFTWKPYKMVTDHHKMTYACNKNETLFDQVNIVLSNGSKIALNNDGCHNYVATTEGPIGRQHWRNENFKWNSVSGSAVTIEMIKGASKTCLKF